MTGDKTMELAPGPVLIGLPGTELDAGDLEVTVNDSDVGTWTLDGDVLSTTLEPGEPAEIAITIDGQPFVFPGDITPFEPPEAEFTGATVACDGQSLSATADGFTSVWTKSG